MTLFLTVDNGLGVAFNHRRQSRDVALISDILSSASSRIAMTEYSAQLFGDTQDIFVCDDPFALPHGDIFCECVDASAYFDLFDKIVVYHWNRDYPHDVLLSKTPDKCGFALESTRDFAGSSHERITKEIWCRSI